MRRRDLIRAHGLQPRDLRRVDPSLSPTKTAPSVTIKDECILINIGGVRAVITGDKCLLFEPQSPSSRKFLEMVAPRLRSSLATRGRGGGDGGGGGNSAGSDGTYDEERQQPFPFELEMVEGALMVATGQAQARAGGTRQPCRAPPAALSQPATLSCPGQPLWVAMLQPSTPHADLHSPPLSLPGPAGKLEAELLAATRRVSSTLQKLPREITPVNLEELRRVKQLLVELESKAENLR